MASAGNRPGAGVVEVEVGGRTVAVPKGGLFDRYRMNADLDEVATDPRVRSVDFFRSLPKTEVQSAIGPTRSPNFYYAMSKAQITYVAPTRALRSRLPEELDPLLATLSNDSTHAYVPSLPVNTDIAQIRGHDGYGFPKWVTDIDVEIDDRRTRARVASDRGCTDIAIDVATPKQKQVPSGEHVSTLTSYTHLNGGWNATLSQTNTLAAGSSRSRPCASMSSPSARTRCTSQSPSRFWPPESEERMQTVLGANGQIAEALTRYLHDNVTEDIRLVSRNPKRLHDSDNLFPANLMDAGATEDAVKGSDIAYLTVGLPMDSTLWEQQFPSMMANTIAACQRHDCKLVFFDNTYMYPRTSAPQVEDTKFEPAGRKATVRAQIATMLLEEMRAERIEAVICRAPEFYGPGKTQSLTNTAIFDRIKQCKRPAVPLNADTRRSLIWTPDASRATGLIGNTPDAYGQTWHLPIDPQRLTYRQMLDVVSEVIGRAVSFSTVRALGFKLGGFFNPEIREASELLPRYRQDNIFDSSKFAERFPDFQVTTYRQGITEILQPQVQ